MASVTLARKLAFLRQSDSYPVEADSVELLETHISWIFFVGDFVYKLKKPVHYSYLDFRTLDARHHDCLEEVRLNRRLAEDTYLDVVPQVETSDGRLVVNAEGRVVDWLVKMKRLPRKRMLDALIDTGQLSPDILFPVAEKLAHFYHNLAPAEITAWEYRQRLIDDIAENQRELANPFFSLPVTLTDTVCDAQLDFLQRHAALLDHRISDGRVIEGHGDLRPEHICLSDPPVIIDCLEFNRNFRLLDAVDELAYLSMECERLGVDWVAEPLQASYSRITGDHPPPKLLHFYAGFRATLRAKIAVWHNLDDGARETEKWRGRALDYLALAESHADKSLK